MKITEDGYGIEWPAGQDIAPHELYENSELIFQSIFSPEQIEDAFENESLYHNVIQSLHEIIDNEL